MFEITPKKMLDYIDTSQLTKNFKNIPAERQKIIKDEISDPENIKAAIDSLQHVMWTDDYPYCAIQIILKNNDTVKVETNRQPTYMQPWRINNVITYDVSINQFFTTAMGGYPKSAMIRLSGNRSPSEIINNIFDNYAQAEIIKKTWQRQNEQAYNKLCQIFELKTLKLYSGPNGEYVNAKLQFKGLPGTVIIDATTSTTDMSFFDKLLAFKDTVLRSFKTRNFVFDYYQNKPQTSIIFGWGESLGSRKLFTSLSKPKFEDLQKSNPSYTIQSLVCFTVFEGKERSEWFLLPDEKLILGSYYRRDVVGLQGNPLNATHDFWKMCFVLFDKNKNIILQ